MSKRLIIAEKTSLGKTIAKALNCKKFNGEKSNGYYENENYIITWCFGHLLELKNIEEYEGLDGVRWEEISLPFMPINFELKIKEAKEKDADGIKNKLILSENLF